MSYRDLSTPTLDKTLEYLRRSIGEAEAEKARREAEAKKTVGQRAAENLVFFGSLYQDGGYQEILLRDAIEGVTHFHSADRDLMCKRLDTMRRVVARAIDKVRADTIEECATVVDAEADCNDQFCGNTFVEGRKIASAIRALNQGAA